MAFKYHAVANSNSGFYAARGVQPGSPEDPGEDIVITDCDDGAEVVIPKTIDGRRVVSAFIAKGTFSGLRKLTVPTGIELECMSETLESVKVTFNPDNPHVEASFPFCRRLEQIEVEEGAVSICDCFATDCTGLKTVEFPPSTLESIGRKAFYNCKSLKLLSLPLQLKSIGEQAFKNCSSIDWLRVPPSVVELGEECLPAGDCWSDNQWRTVIVCDPGSAVERFVLEEDAENRYSNNREIDHMGARVSEGLTSASKEEPEKKAEGCYIATAVYGSYDCPQVWTLRRFRDFRLRRSAAGRAFVSLYYAASPALARRLGGGSAVAVLVRSALDRLSGMLQKRGFDSAPYDDGFCKDPSREGGRND